MQDLENLMKFGLDSNSNRGMERHYFRRDMIALLFSKACTHISLANVLEDLCHGICRR